MAVEVEAQPSDEPLVRAITKLRLEPGDVIVLESQLTLTQDRVEHMYARIRRVFPDHKTIILDGGLTIGVLSEAETARARDLAAGTPG